MSANEKIGLDWLLRLLLITRGLMVLGVDGVLMPSA